MKHIPTGKVYGTEWNPAESVIFYYTGVNDQWDLDKKSKRVKIPKWLNDLIKKVQDEAYTQGGADARKVVRDLITQLKIFNYAAATNDSKSKPGSGCRGVSFRPRRREAGTTHAPAATALVRKLWTHQVWRQWQDVRRVQPTRCGVQATRQRLRTRRSCYHHS